MNLKPSKSLLHLFIASLVTCFVLYTGAVAQSQAAGGKTTSGAASQPAKTTKPASKSPSSAPKAKARTVNQNPSSPGAGSNIAGKWWTTGNDFGAGEVVFTQSGSNVSGVITYSDGRTGSVNGKMIGKRLQHTFTTSDGGGGSGWLELSWNNFLGGAWRNQRTKDGSWTLSRIEGNWCFGGNRSRVRRVTHDALGRISMVTEDGTQEEGRLDGPWLYLHSDMGDIKGGFDFRANRVTWSTGFYWTWCGRLL